MKLCKIEGSKNETKDNLVSSWNTSQVTHKGMSHAIVKQETLSEFHSMWIKPWLTNSTEPGASYLLIIERNVCKNSFTITDVMRCEVEVTECGGHPVWWEEPTWITPDITSDTSATVFHQEFVPPHTLHQVYITLHQVMVSEVTWLQVSVDDYYYLTCAPQRSLTNHCESQLHID